MVACVNRRPPINGCAKGSHRRDFRNHAVATPKYARPATTITLVATPVGVRTFRIAAIPPRKMSNASRQPNPTRVMKRSRIGIGNIYVRSEKKVALADRRGSDVRHVVAGGERANDHEVVAPTCGQIGRARLPGDVCLEDI